MKKITRVELNRRTRRKELLRTEAEAKKIENLSKEIDRSLSLSLKQALLEFLFCYNCTVSVPSVS